MKLNLTANNIPEERIKEYLEQNASPTLAEKINFGTPYEKDGKQLINRKTLQGFFKYAGEEARKVAQKGANFACIDDNTVFGWSIHYFEEEAIVGELFNPDGTPYAPKTTAPKIVTPASEKKAPKKDPTPKPGTNEPKKAKILPTPTAKPTKAYPTLPKPTKADPMQKLNKNKPIDTDQLSIFDLF
jgi:hypothetical protein